MYGLSLTCAFCHRKYGLSPLCTVCQQYVLLSLAALLFWFFGGFRCGVPLFIVMLVIY